MPLNAKHQSLHVNLHVIYISSSQTLISMLSVLKSISYMLLKHHVIQLFKNNVESIVKAKFQKLFFMNYI